jgi:hypothetical protein
MPIRYIQTEQGDIEIFPSRLKLLGLALGSLPLIAGSHLVLRFSPIPTLWALGVFGIVFFGTAGAFAVYRLVVSRPAVRLTPYGILDSSSLLARLGFPVVSIPEVVLPGRIDDLAVLLAARFAVRVEGAVFHGADAVEPSGSSQ